MVARLVTPAVMVLGTASSVGKSLIAAAVCRILSDRGLRVAPFKAQNMSLEAAVTPDGAEIGRAQFVQACAARRTPVAEMNPILLKPTGERRSQVVLLGRVLGDEDAWDYHRRRTAELFPVVLDAYSRLARDADVMVIEGAGSPAEINLRDGDIVNMRMAEAANARCLLVADIDRGGAFAALVGTLALLEPLERARIVAFALNRFRGDAALLAPGVTAIERREAVPCAGVIPWLADLDIEDEDRYAAQPWPAAWDDETGARRRLRIAVLDFPHGSNLSDAEPLRREPSLALRMVRHPEALRDADVVILPGSKSTLADLRWMHEAGLAATIREFAKRQRPIVGLCGGYQMLGRAIDDPHGVEGAESGEGLGLLDASTALNARKTTRRVHGTTLGAPDASAAFEGYEIHFGVTRTRELPFARLRSAAESWDDGAVSADGLIVGTYVHDLFAVDALRHAFVRSWRASRGLEAARDLVRRPTLDARIDRWAAHVAAHLDVDRVLGDFTARAVTRA
ncbi:MAG: Cobyric acid synthase [Candidatus Eremiobacteraeota bacterium]|nr:Cobyric acid synthase [Candidatus Eremiobacteraeota bacterium]